MESEPLWGRSQAPECFKSTPQGILKCTQGRGIGLGAESGGQQCTERGCSPIGSSQEQAQVPHHIEAPGQGGGGQAPGPKLQESVPQNA